MSLTFRRVTKISKKSRKTKSKTGKAEVSMKPSVEDTTYLENFPSLNAVYKSGIFGTPVKYHFSCGSDHMWNLRYRVKCHVLVFMEEYSDKSVEELRWEDYQCNRKGEQFFEEKKYLKSLTSKSVDVAPPPSDSVDDDALLTSIANFEDTSKTANSDRRRRNANNREENIQILKNNLLRYFEHAVPDANMPYDFVPSPKFYLPCADVKFVYQNARPSLKADQANRRFDPLESVRLAADSQTSLETCDGLLEKKYTMENKFQKDYFWNRMNPYSSNVVTLGVCKAKHVLSGRYIVD